MFSSRMFTCMIRGDHDKKMAVRPNSEVIIRYSLRPEKTSHSRNSMTDEQGGKMTLLAPIY
jgi:hypothetical protein